MSSRTKIRNILKRVLTPFLQRYTKWYFSKPRPFTYKGIDIIVEPGVFYPQLTLSTKILMDYIDEELDLKDEKILELGCGTGIISIFVAKKGAIVTASDISEKAVQNCSENASRNKVEIESLQSDLFSNLQTHLFDIIIINPPYYPKNPKSSEEHAWFCGKNFEYFESLFKQVSNRSQSSKIIMILSEDCDLNQIKNIALQNGLTFQQIKSIEKAKEQNYIYEIEIKMNASV